MSSTVLRLPLAAFAATPVAPRSGARVRDFEARYRTGLDVPPIPIWYDRHGNLLLLRDGNHRLAGARLAGVSTVTVNVDERDAPRLRARFGV